MKKNLKLIVPITLVVIFLGVAAIMQSNMRGAVDTNQMAAQQADQEQVALLEKNRAKQPDPTPPAGLNASQVKGLAAPKGPVPPADDEPEKIPEKKTDDDESGGAVGIPCILVNQQQMDAQLDPKKAIPDEGNLKGQWYRDSSMTASTKGSVSAEDLQSPEWQKTHIKTKKAGK